MGPKNARLNESKWKELEPFLDATWKSFINREEDSNKMN